MPQPICLREGAPQDAFVYDFGEVEKGPRDGGNRDPVDHRSIFLVDSAFVQGDARSTPASDSRNVHVGLARLRDAPQCRGAAMTQERSAAAGKDSAEPFSALGHSRLAQGKHLAMQREETPGFDTTSDRSGAEASGQQLAPRDYAMLPPGQHG
jgi:hypothetical protein